MNSFLVKELSDHSESILDRLNIEMSYIVKSIINQLLETAVKRMESENRTTEADIRQAKSALSTFIREMNSLREVRAGQKDLLRYQSLYEARTHLCPLWPVC